MVTSLHKPLWTNLSHGNWFRYLTELVLVVLFMLVRAKSVQMKTLGKLKSFLLCSTSTSQFCSVLPLVLNPLLAVPFYLNITYLRFATLTLQFTSGIIHHLTGYMFHLDDASHYLWFDRWWMARCFVASFDACDDWIHLLAIRS